MGIKVKLQKIVDGLEMQGNESTSYFNKETGEIVIIMDEEFEAAENAELARDCPDWQKKAIERARDILEDVDQKTFLPLPTKFDIH